MPPSLRGKRLRRSPDDHAGPGMCRTARGWGGGGRRKGLTPPPRAHPRRNGARLTGAAVFRCRVLSGAAGGWFGVAGLCDSPGVGGEAPAGRCDTGPEGVFNGLRAPPATREGSPLTKERWKHRWEAERGSGERHRRRGVGAGAAAKPEAAAGEARRAQARRRPWRRLHAQQRRLKPPPKGVASPFLCRRGGDGTGSPLLPPPPPAAASAARPPPHTASRRAPPCSALLSPEGRADPQRSALPQPSAGCEGEAAPRRALPGVNAFPPVGCRSVSPSLSPSSPHPPGGGPPRSPAAMSINGGSHPRINTLGRMARADSGTDLRYEMSSHVVGGGGGGGTHTHKTYYYQKTYGGDYASDGYG